MIKRLLALAGLVTVLLPLMTESSLRGLCMDFSEGESAVDQVPIGD